MELDSLSEVLASEQREETAFHSLPYHFIEHASILFETAAEDIPEADRVRTVLEDIQNIRMAKIRRGIQNLAKQVNEEARITSVNLTNIAAMEIFQIRPFLTGTLNSFYSMAIMPSEQGRARSSEVPRMSRASTAGGGGGGGGEADDGAPSSSRKSRRFQ
jgi:GINS complex subunit 2